MRYLFCGGPAKPLGRFENHYMYQMASRVQVPITTIADGTAMAIIVPQGSLNKGWVQGFAQWPFCCVAAASTLNPLVVQPTYSPDGPFFGQTANVQNYAVDACILNFIET